MSDGAATCKQDKAKVSLLHGRRAHDFGWLKHNAYNFKMINTFTKQGAPFK